jgi:hypothetical protein
MLVLTSHHKTTTPKTQPHARLPKTNRLAEINRICKRHLPYYKTISGQRIHVNKKDFGQRSGQ